MYADVVSREKRAKPPSFCFFNAINVTIVILRAEEVREAENKTEPCELREQMLRLAPSKEHLPAPIKSFPPCKTGSL